MRIERVLVVAAVVLYAAYMRRRLAAETARADMYRELAARRDRQLAQLGR